MHIHILGICGTFMGGLAALAKASGHEITGSDMNVYPPMSTQLERMGIHIMSGYANAHLDPAPDLVIIGNTLSRGNECIEYVLDNCLSYISGPQWLAEHVLRKKRVLAVSGTHGKTTTASMLAWLLEDQGKQPGFLIGGIAENFGVSARSGDSDYFVIEADEYDTAFFDKRSKFIHYHPNTLTINNIEYDHADIFTDIDAIKREFHHLIRTMPANGKIIVRHNDTTVGSVLGMGCWTPVESFGIETGDWSTRVLSEDFSRFEVLKNNTAVGEVTWPLIGRHNAENALAALAAAVHTGIEPEQGCLALSRFKSVKRRLEKLACVGGITVYDDFAHHPTAIRATLDALRQNVGEQRIITILEPRSNTMKMGVHKQTLAQALSESDRAFLYQSSAVAWDLNDVAAELGKKCRSFNEIEEIINMTVAGAEAGDHIVIMSNGSFENIHQRLIQRLQHV